MRPSPCRCWAAVAILSEMATFEAAGVTDAGLGPLSLLPRRPFLTRVPVGRFVELDGRAVTRAAPSTPWSAPPSAPWRAPPSTCSRARYRDGGGHDRGRAGRPAHRRDAPTRWPTPPTRSAAGRGSAGWRSCATTRSAHSGPSHSSSCCWRSHCSRSSAPATSRSSRSPPPARSRAGRHPDRACAPVREGRRARPLARDGDLARGRAGRARPGSGDRRDRARRGAGAALGAAAGVALLLGLFYRRWLGGVTGDALGAATALSQAACLVAAYAVA